MENGFKSISQSLFLAEVMHVNKSKYLVDSGIQCQSLSNACGLSLCTVI